MAAGRILGFQSLVRSALACGVMAAGVSGFAGGLAADADISGSWSGGGSVAFASGSKEKARCRATYARSGASSYKVSATCATASGKVAQTASVKRNGPASFSGNFYNPDFDATGVIHISVNGNSQNVTLTSALATASLRLTR